MHRRGPRWLAIDPATGELTGTAGRFNVRTHTVRLFVSDGTVEVEQPFTIVARQMVERPQKRIARGNLPEGKSAI